MVESGRHVPVGETAWWPSLLDPLKQAGARLADYFSPSADAAADDDAYQIEIELPGVKQDDIDISLNDNVLTVKGEKRSEREEKTKEYFFSERLYGAFQRSFKLPNDVSVDGISADFSDGVLKITLPKLGEAAQKARKIKIGG